MGLHSSSLPLLAPDFVGGEWSGKLFAGSRSKYSQTSLNLGFNVTGAKVCMASGNILIYLFPILKKGGANLLQVVLTPASVITCVIAVRKYGLFSYVTGNF